jgi:NAD(P)-dependent dehydrogenase (short-subunit alcohol dehydrogenase family)
MAEVPQDLAGQVGIVTGSASGIGRAIARALAPTAGGLLLVDINREAGEAEAAALRRFGGEIVFLHADVSDPAQCERMAGIVRERFGRLDFAINNAGIGDGPEVENTHDYPIDRWRRIVDVDLCGVFYCLRYELPLMLESGGGAIVNTASISGLVSFPGTPAYTAAKHGVIGLTKVVCNEYAARGIRCNAIAPGIIDTPLTAGTLALPDWQASLRAMIPAGRIGTPEEVADVAIWLCSDAARYVNGQTIAVDAGILVR